jgi:hypothetical protein
MSGFNTPTIPNLADFTMFAIGQLGATSAQLPPTSPYLGYAFNVAQQLVYAPLQQASPLIFTLATYNLALDTLVNFCPDQPNQTFFKNLRGPKPGGFALFNFVPGVVTAAADVSTSDSLVVPDFMKNLTLANLQNLKTPWGLQYLALVQSYGTLWGIS